MTLLPENLDYTNRDFESIRSRLIRLAASKGWIIEEVAEGERVPFDALLLELIAFAADVVGFYLDAEAREARWSTARQRRSQIAHAKLVGFRPRGTVAARVDIVFTLAAVPVGDVQLDTFQEIRTADVAEPAVFQLQEPLFIAGGANPPTATVIAENSAFQQQPFQSVDVANQFFKLARGPYVDLSASVVAADGIYEDVDSLLTSGPTDRHFVVSVGDDEVATITFGNGVSGTIPAGIIQTSYQIGGGSAGNVAENLITVITGTFVDEFANPVSISLTNPERASGGLDSQTADEIRVAVPEFVRSLNRTVGEDDFVAAARRVMGGGVNGRGRALILTADQDLSVPENRGFLYVVPPDGEAPTELLKASILEEVLVTRPKTITFQVEVRDPVFRIIDISARIFREAGTSQAQARDNIEATMDEFFAVESSPGVPNPEIDFGLNIRDQDGNPDPNLAWSRVLRGVINSAGIFKVGDGDADFLLNGQSDDVLIESFEFPKLGTISLVDGNTNEVI